MADDYQMNAFQFLKNYTCHLEYRLGVDPKGSVNFPKEKIDDGSGYYSFELNNIDSNKPGVFGPFFNGVGGKKEVLPLKLLSSKQYGPDRVSWYSIEGKYEGFHMIKILGVEKNHIVEATVYKFEQLNSTFSELDKIQGAVPLQTTFWGKCKVKP